MSTRTPAELAAEQVQPSAWVGMAFWPIWRDGYAAALRAASAEPSEAVTAFCSHPQNGVTPHAVTSRTACPEPSEAEVEAGTHAAVEVHGRYEEAGEIVIGMKRREVRAALRAALAVRGGRHAG
jgi:hypothetical protein